MAVYKLQQIIRVSTLHRSKDITTRSMNKSCYRNSLKQLLFFDKTDR